jgi:hypothetical protein
VSVARAWTLALALLALATWAAAELLPAHVPGGPALRLWPPPDADDPLAGWTLERGKGRVEVIDGILRLEAPRADPYVLLRRPLEAPPGTLAFQISAEARFAGTGGLRPVEAARIHLMGRDAEGRLLPDRREDALRARSDRDWQLFAADLAPPPGAAGSELLVRLQRAAGRLELRSLEVRPLVAGPWLGPARLALALAWLGLLALGGGLLLHRAVRRPWAAAALAAAAAALVLILLPPELADRLLPAGLLRAVLAGPAVPLLGHALMAATVAALAARALELRRLPGPAAVVLVAAAAGEAVQLLASGREASLEDLLANALGGLGGLVLARRLVGPAPPAEPEPERAEIARALELRPLAPAEPGG